MFGTELHAVRLGLPCGRQIDRAAQMQKMQMQARMARGQLAGAAAGGRRPMGGMMSATNDDDEFSIRPTSRGISGLMSQRRGPLTQVNGPEGILSGPDCYDGAWLPRRHVEAALPFILSCTRAPLLGMRRNHR